MDGITFLQTPSGLSVLLHGVISLPDATHRIHLNNSVLYCCRCIMPWSHFLTSQMSFNAIPDNKILAKISKFYSSCILCFKMILVHC